MFNIALGALFVFVFKEQGLLFTAGALGIISASGRVLELCSILLKNTSLQKKYVGIITVSVGLTLTSFSYQYLPAQVWYLSVVALLAIDAMIKNSFYNDYDSIVKRLLSSEAFRDMMYAEGVLHSVTSILGSLVGGGLAYLFMTNDVTASVGLQECLYGVGVLTGVGAVLAYTQYARYFSKISLARVLDDSVKVSSIEDLEY